MCAGAHHASRGNRGARLLGSLTNEIILFPLAREAASRGAFEYKALGHGGACQPFRPEFGGENIDASGIAAGSVETCHQSALHWVERAEDRHHASSDIDQ